MFPDSIQLNQPEQLPARHISMLRRRREKDGRVLVHVRTNKTVLPAWLYVVGDRWAGTFKALTSRIWL